MPRSSPRWTLFRWSDLEELLAGVAGREDSVIANDVVVVVVVGAWDEAAEVVLDLVRGDIAKELADVGRFLVAGRSTRDGLPENTTDTFLAVLSWLLLVVGEAGSSMLESS